MHAGSGGAPCMRMGQEWRGNKCMMTGRRRTRPTATAMAVCLALALSLMATAKSFVLPTRAVHQAQAGLMSSLDVDLAAAATCTFPRRSFGRRGGRTREVVGGIRGGNSGPVGALSASSVDAVGGEVLDVLGGNEGVLSEEQRAMAATLVQLGQVSGGGELWERESEVVCASCCAAQQ